MSRNTGESCIDLLGKSIVVFRLRGFSENIRKEMAQSCKVFFYQSGVCNSLIENLKLLRLLDNVGRPWENR
jgi:predicted AAA+ superfamily ATPase